MSKLEVKEIGPISGETDLTLGQSGGTVTLADGATAVGFGGGGGAILQQKYITTTTDEVAGPINLVVDTSLILDFTPTDLTTKIFIQLSARFVGDGHEAGCYNVYLYKSVDDFVSEDLLANFMGTGRSAQGQSAFYIGEHNTTQKTSYKIKHLGYKAGSGSSKMLAGATLMLWEISQ